MINGIVVQNNPLKYIDPRGLTSNEFKRFQRNEVDKIIDFDLVKSQLANVVAEQKFNNSPVGKFLNDMGSVPIGPNVLAVGTTIGTKAATSAPAITRAAVGAFNKVKNVGSKLLSKVLPASKEVSVIGPRSTYREFAEKIGANFLNVTDDAWSMRKNVKFLQGVVKRGDDVAFSGKYNPKLLDTNSVLAQEIRYLKRHGYLWNKDLTKLIKK